MPRPPTYDEPASEAIRIRVTPAQKTAIQTVAAENGLDVAAVVREAVNSFVADYHDGDPVFRGPKPNAA